MHEEEIPKVLNERTGRHFCVRCLTEVPSESYFCNDHVCDACAATDEYPLQSTSGTKPPPE